MNKKGKTNFVANKKGKTNFVANKKAQEEMIGFAFIIVIVAVILVIFVGFILTKPSKNVGVESYEIDSFVQSMLQYTTECESYLGKMSLQKLIYSCEKQEICLNKEYSCDVLNKTVKDILEKSWPTENGPEKAWEFNILNEEGNFYSLSKGNLTGNYKGSTQKLPKDITIIFNVYY